MKWYKKSIDEFLDISMEIGIQVPIFFFRVKDTHTHNTHTPTRIHTHTHAPRFSTLLRHGILLPPLALRHISPFGGIWHPRILGAICRSASGGKRIPWGSSVENLGAPADLCEYPRVKHKREKGNQTPQPPKPKGAYGTLESWGRYAGAPAEAR